MTNKHAHHNDFDIHGDIARIKAALADTVEDVKGKASQLFTQSIEDVEDRRDALQTVVKKYVNKKPLRSIGYAALAGALLGYFMRR